MSLFWNWCELSADLLQIFLELLLGSFNLVLNVVVSFVNISNFLESFQLILLVLSGVGRLLSPISVEDTKISGRRQIHWFYIPPVEMTVLYIPLYVFTHILDDGSLSVHSSSLLGFCLSAYMVKRSTFHSWVLGRLLLIIVHLYGTDLV